MSLILPVFCRGPSTAHHPTTVDEEIITRRSAGPLHLSHLASGSSRSRSEDRENRPPSMPPGIPQFLRIPAEREEDGFRLPVIPPPPPLQQAWGPGSQPHGQGLGAPPFPLLRLSAGPPQPGVYTPPTHLPYFVSDSGMPAASLMPPPPPPQAAAQLRPLSFGHVPPQVRGFVCVCVCVCVSVCVCV